MNNLFGSLLEGIVKRLTPQTSDQRTSTDQSFSYRANFPDFWQSFIMYVATTQRDPTTIENLKHNFYNNYKISRHLIPMQEQGQDISGILEKCIQQLGGKIIPRDDYKTFSIVSGKQLPALEVPSGGEYDIPLNFVLARKNPKRDATRWYNALKSYISSKDPGVLINVGGTRRYVLQGGSYQNDILTVGGAIEFISVYGLPCRFIHRIGEKGKEVIETALNVLKSPN